jgi:hypothetical protein
LFGLLLIIAPLSKKEPKKNNNLQNRWSVTEKARQPHLPRFDLPPKTGPVVELE